MGYVRISWPDSQKYTSLPESVLESFEETEVIVFGNDGAILIDEDEIEEIDRLCEVSDETEESDLPEDIKTKISALAEKYSSEEEDVSEDCLLKTPIPLASRKSNVYAFYVWQNWIYLLDDDGADIDPNDVEVEFLERFIEYISDENNVTVEN